MPDLYIAEIFRHFQIVWGPYINEGWLVTVSREGLKIWRSCANDNRPMLHPWRCVTEYPKAPKFDYFYMPHAELIEQMSVCLHKVRFPIL
jgi:hypothetical protein